MFRKEILEALSILLDERKAKIQLINDTWTEINDINNRVDSLDEQMQKIHTAEREARDERE